MKYFLISTLIYFLFFSLSLKGDVPVAKGSIEHFCANDTTYFTNQSNTANVQWIFDDGTDTRLENPKHIYTNAGTYTVELIAISDDGSLTSSKIFNIEIKPEPTLTLSFSKDLVGENTAEFYDGENVTIQVNESFQKYTWFQWIDDAWEDAATGGSSIISTQTADYKVLVVDVNECKASETAHTIAVQRPDEERLFRIIFENNIITPNGDGYNEYLRVKFFDTYGEKTIQLTVYNIWGDPVYTDNDYQNNWGGMGVNQEIVDAGTYYYVAKSKGRIGATGYVDIIR